MVGFVTFLHSEVPDFLKESDFYLSLDDADHEPISIPADCAKFSLKLCTDEFENDLRSLLNTFRFWGVYRLLHMTEFTTFILTAQDKTLCRNVLSEFEAELIEMRVLIKTLDGKTKEKALCTAISLGEFQLVKIMASNKYTFSQSCVEAAAQHNQVDCLEFALSEGCSWEPYLMNIAAKQGHVEILKFAHDRGLERGFGVCASAADAGHLSCLQYAYENGYQWPKKVCPVSNLPIALYARSVGAEWANFSCCDAAKVGSVDVLQYLREGNDYPYPISNTALLVAVWTGHTDCVHFLRSIDIPWTGSECQLASYRGHLDTLKYLCESGCPRNELDCWVCTIHDNVDCLRYLHELGCPWDCKTVPDCQHGWTDPSKTCPQCKISTVLSYSDTGHIGAIEHLGEFWYREHPYMQFILFELGACQKPDIHRVYQACQGKCIIGIAALCTYYKATRCLQYAFSQGCVWPNNPFHLPNLTDESIRRCVYSFCQPWCSETSANAAMCNTVVHLKTLHKNGCPWDKRTVMNALHSYLNNGTIKSIDESLSNFFCLRYAVRHNCPYEIEEVRAAIAKNKFYRKSKSLRKIFPWIAEDERAEEQVRAGRKRLLCCTGAMLALAVAQVTLRAFGLAN